METKDVVMIEDLLNDGVLKSVARLLLVVVNFCVRILLFLIIDVCVDIIGWWIGWGALRLFTLGHYPSRGISEHDKYSGGFTLLVSLLGLVIVIGTATVSAELLMLLS